MLKCHSCSDKRPDPSVMEAAAAWKHVLQACVTFTRDLEWSCSGRLKTRHLAVCAELERKSLCGRRVPARGGHAMMKEWRPCWTWALQGW